MINPSCAELLEALDRALRQAQGASAVRRGCEVMRAEPVEALR
jgi:hypothetical protein